VKKFWIILAAAVVIGSAAVWAMSGDGSGADSQAFRLAPVSQGNIKATVSSTGTLNPLKTVKVGSQVSGIIKEIYVDYNSPVHRDQIIAQIDPAFYEAQVEQAQAQLLMAQAQHRENQKSILAAEAAVDSAIAQLSSAKATQREADQKFQRFRSLDKKKSFPSQIWIPPWPKKTMPRAHWTWRKPRSKQPRRTLIGPLPSRKDPKRSLPNGKLLFIWPKSS